MDIYHILKYMVMVFQRNQVFGHIFVSSNDHPNHLSDTPFSCTTSHVESCSFLESREHDFIEALINDSHRHPNSQLAQLV